MNFLKKWKNKKFIDKLSDILLLLLVVVILIPSSRREILTGVNKIRAAVVQPSVKKNKFGKLQKDAIESWLLIDADSTIFDLKNTENKVIFINFWATWCGPCIAELPRLQKMYDNFKNNPKIIFLFIAEDKPENVSPFIKKHNYNLPVYYEVNSPPKLLRSSSIPTSFLIDKNGNIVMRIKGTANWSGNKMKKIITDLINE